MGHSHLTMICCTYKHGVVDLAFAVKRFDYLSHLGVCNLHQIAIKI